ncbi:hypothetical protein [Ferrimonas sp. YFM]|uniref:hypothetical protein n=1 Tax=Ferrimonas sp. YFM TaxID=3028878 RepID=UPI0025722A29|nr:hypothetical protein [Ferrimonas sp. YFM]BDY05489.1 hypothetical protein F0521_25300 [Ferrimonas sp. YFM]
MLRRFLIVILFFPLALRAATLPPLAGEDQFGQPCALSSDTRLLLFSHDKAGSHLAMEAIARLWPDGDAPMQLVVDTRDVPGWVMSWFMLPKLRRHNTPLCLDEQGVMTRALLPEEGQVLLIGLNNLSIEEQSGFTDIDALAEALEQIPRS